MSRALVRGEQAQELRSLYDQLETATGVAAEMLRTYGVDSEEFSVADNQVAGIWRQIRELLSVN